MVELEIAGTVELARPYEEEALWVRIRLEDTTLLDAPSHTMAEARCKLNTVTSRSVAFTLTVDDGVLDPRHDYVLSARAEQSGQVKPALYGTVQSYPWTANDRSHRHLEIQRLN